MTAYYNEIDPYAAQWLRNLIAAGHIAPGDVDERSIEDVTPDDLRPYTQCHFFAGIGVWSHALRAAGWPDDRPVWTGSCPCQPFSAAGKGGGFADERHLWPAFHHLIRECGPGVVFGEQVASKDGLAWLDLVQADLEGSAYASGAIDLCAAGVGAPHIRQRLWWCAERIGASRGAAGEKGAHHHAILPGRSVRLEHDTGYGRIERWAEPSGRGAAGGCGDGGLDDHNDARLEGQRSGHRAALGHGQGSVRPASEAGQSGGLGHPERLGAGRDAGAGAGAQGGSFLRPIGDGAGSPGPVRGLADAGRDRQHHEQGKPGEQESQREWRHQPIDDGHAGGPGPTNGLWRDADWLFCRDGKWRPVEPGTFPLAHGAASRVGRLRAYGNAIVAQAAQAFVEAYLDARHPVLGLRLTDVSELTNDIDQGVFA